MPGWPGEVKSRLGAAGARLTRGGQVLLDWLYPPHCPLCGTALIDAGGVCAACWRDLRPITAPYCPVLGVPFSTDLGPGALSAEAIADPPPFGRARAAYVYNAPARALVSRLKYADRTELAPMMGQAMARAAADLLGDGALLVPVPLHPLRQWRRRYNQSTALAQAIAATTGLALDPFLLRRVRRTRHQVGLSAAERARNVAGAFVAHPEALARVKGRRVVLVDDVYTTGATAKAAVRALVRAGVANVDIVTFARVVMGGD